MQFEDIDSLQDLKCKRKALEQEAIRAKQLLTQKVQRSLQKGMLPAISNPNLLHLAAQQAIQHWVGPSQTGTLASLPFVPPQIKEGMQDLQQVHSAFVQDQPSKWQVLLPIVLKWMPYFKQNLFEKGA